MQILRGDYIPFKCRQNKQRLFPLHNINSLNLVNDQLDAQFFYFIIRLLQFSTCFEQRRAHHQEVKLYYNSIWYGHSVSGRPVHRTATYRE